MKASNALTKMRRVGSVKINNENGHNKTFTLTGKTHELTVNTQGDDAIIFTVRRLNDHSDSMTDYFAGTNYRNFKGAMNSYLESENK